MIVREEVRGTSGQDLAKINDNFSNLFLKLYGNINFEDVGQEVQRKLTTQYFTFQGESNLDGNYPMYVRFFVPPNVKIVKNAVLNAIVEAYRMDSGVALSQTVSCDLDLDINLATSPVTVRGQVQSGGTKTSQNGGGATSEDGGGGTSLDGGNYTLPIARWGISPNLAVAPTEHMISSDIVRPPLYLVNNHGYVTTADTKQTLGVVPFKVTYKDVDMEQGFEINVVDLWNFAHEHDIPPHYHALREHSHWIKEHQHLIDPHTHEFVATTDPHTHTGKVHFTLPTHDHPLNEGIKISTKAIEPVTIKVNDNNVTTITSAELTKNGVDITDKIKIGQWNIIQVNSTSVARCTIYGNVECIMQR